MNACIEAALKHENSKVWYCSPLYKQTKEIAWNLFQVYLPQEFIVQKNESELKFKLINGSEIALKGTDNYDSLVGVGLTFCVLDEFPLMKPEVWTKIVRPMLIDSKGQCLFIGTPRGYNWAYDLYQRSKTDADFESFSFHTVENTSIKDIDKEVEKARSEAQSELEKITFRQEYEASFEVITGRPRFNTEILSQLLERSQTGITRGDGLNLFFNINKNSKYILGVDTSEGLLTGDRCAVVVLDATTKSIVGYYAGFMAPDLLAIAVADWAKEFNNALVVVEDNNHGLVTLNELKKIYFNLYYRKVKDEVTDQWTEKVGWRTSSRTKPLLIGNLDKQIRAGLYIPAKEILNELTTYVILEDGKTEASEGSKDDLVMALGCAVQGYLETNTLQDKEPTKPNAQSGVSILDQILNPPTVTTYRYNGNIHKR